MRFHPVLSLILILAAACSTARGAGLRWQEILKQPDAWYQSEPGMVALANILSYQTQQGDWPKNLDTSASRFAGDRSQLKGTFDNGATVGELRVLARAIRVKPTPAYELAFTTGLDHILAAQYKNGGWPQSSPPGKGYARYITFNDNTMVNLLQFLRDVSRSPEFGFVDESRRKLCAKAFDRGVECILQAQIRVKGVLTVWCAQHDEQTLEPRPARSYELVSLSGAESSGILKLLMSLEAPSDSVKKSVEAGVAWFDRAKLKGIRQTIKNGDKLIEADPNAPPLWARFYEIDTNRPFFCGRDGKPKQTLAEIEPERRNGYSWYGTWGDSLAREYSAWKQRLSRLPAR